MILPQLDCELGYYTETIDNFLVSRQCLPENFWQWMRGQTMGVVNGNDIVYVQDLIRYLNGGGLNATIID